MSGFRWFLDKNESTLFFERLSYFFHKFVLNFSLTKLDKLGIFGWASFKEDR